MRLPTPKRNWIVPALALTVAGAAALTHKASAAPTGPEALQRCARRVAISITGKAPSAELLASPNPQGQVDQLVASTDFIERFSGYINSEMNPGTGMTPVEDASYHMMKYVLTNNLPYKDMFLGKYNVNSPNGMPNTVTVDADPAGLGYFHSRAWLVRYAGNEPAGIKIVTAYRIMQNVVGLKLTAVSNAPTTDVSKNARITNVNCSQCHLPDTAVETTKWWGLDKIASILTVRKGMGNNMTFDPQTTAEIDIAGQKIHNDIELVQLLTSSEDFNFNVCRLAFKYLNGRAENTCEAAVFDKCVADFKASGKIQAAVASIAKDTNFCQ
ncbi:MAG: hypothetical protein U0174_17410 [Polyangiaceae bacterium]